MSRFLDDATLKRMFPGLADEALDAVRGELTTPREVVSEVTRDLEGWTWESIALRACDRFLELRHGREELDSLDDFQLLTMVASDTWPQGRDLGFEEDLASWEVYLAELLFPMKV